MSESCQASQIIHCRSKCSVLMHVWVLQPSKSKCLLGTPRNHSDISCKGRTNSSTTYTGNSQRPCVSHRIQMYGIITYIWLIFTVHVGKYYDTCILWVCMHLVFLIISVSICVQGWNKQKQRRTNPFFCWSSIKQIILPCLRNSTYTCARNAFMSAFGNQPAQLYKHKNAESSSK